MSFAEELERYLNAAGEEELERFCMDLPRYKRPKKFIFDDVIRNATGKLDKVAMRKKYGGLRLVEQQNRA